MFNQSLVLNNLKSSGATLANIALGRIKTQAEHFYEALRKGKLTWPSPSELALNDNAMELLWNDSAQLVGLFNF